MCLKQNSEIFPLNPFPTNVQSGAVTCGGLGTVVSPVHSHRLNNKPESLELPVTEVWEEWERSHHNPTALNWNEMCFGVAALSWRESWLLSTRPSVNSLISAWQNCSSLCRFSSAEH